ncbi:MAG: hypothetical protein H0T89_19625 [Deltaproteobacteria bacterium]|nr:hypothetical protein [Deltaproteobacteria bacterium]MDQ3299285.1 hypothetical protein [Myxococcota bacterium]
MNELEGRDATPGKATAEPAGETAKAPGKQTLSEGGEGGDVAKPDPVFSGAEQWEAVEAAPDREEVADAGADDQLAEVRAGLQEEMTALAETHTCHAGCLHGQLDSMMSAQTSNHSAFRIAPGAIEEAAERERAGKAPAADATAGTATPPPQLAGGNEAQSGTGSDEVGHSGTVTAGKPAKFPKVFGLASWNFGKFTYPDLKIDTAQQPDKSWDATIKTTTSTDAPTSAIATPAGVYPLGGNEQVFNPTVNKKVPLKKQLGIRASAAAQIVVAEQEHLDDITQAYNITLKAAEAAVNAQASKAFNAASKKAAQKLATDSVKAALDPKLTADPKKWRAMLQTCANLTKSGRDASGWHTFDSFADVGDIDFTAKTITYQVINNPKVGSTPSATLIKL